MLRLFGTFKDIQSGSRSEKICAALRACYPKWMSRTDIRDLFGRNVDVKLIDAALSEVESFDMIETSKEGSRGELYLRPRQPIGKYALRNSATRTRSAYHGLT